MPTEQYLRPDPTVTEFLYEQRPLREIADFADLVRRAREAATLGEDFTQWCTTARKRRPTGGKRSPPSSPRYVTVLSGHC
ncbi:hypothetical protein NKH18_05125 [Streptomyces sp. M10(2022)]